MKNPVVMGILNITPDSFSDGGKFYQHQKANIALALKRALQMHAEGAAIIDVGGESTRPGAAKMTVQEELDRVIPVVEAIAAENPVMISIDTSKAQVMKEAIRAGATFINDVYALQKDNALDVVAGEIRSGKSLQVCLMHMQGDPQTMQQAPSYRDVVEEIKTFLRQRISACEAVGITKNHLVIDPGFGFGKTLEHNLSLVKHLSSLDDLGCPILVGLSRKSMIARLTGSVEMNDRLSGSLALAWACVQQGAKIVRAHDVKETVQMLKVYQALQVAS